MTIGTINYLCKLLKAQAKNGRIPQLRQKVSEIMRKIFGICRNAG